MAKLIIVESPTKAKTITKFLGKGYKVESSFGHIRDLPKSKMGVDIEGLTFEPSYVIPRDKSAQVKKLKEIAKKSDGVIFATDEDREGEAISWHLANVLGIKPEKAERMVFHEITEHAIKEALEHPRALNLRLVDAQQARRVLDRLVGYELSPFLWRKVAKGLSAGRVQSVSVRLVVEREREIQNFKPVEYWSLEGTFEKIGSKEEIKAKLQAIKDKKLDKLGLKNKDEVDGIVKALQGVKYEVSNLEEKTVKRNPSPPFTTSSLQQEANNHLGYSAKQTMRLAQQLYEGVELGSEGSIGLITYMRTDSVNLSDKFLHEAKTEIAKSFGDKYTLPSVRAYKSKSKNAQEAHEAIRPTSADRSPELIKPFVEPKLYKLYDLIWRRALSTQMAAAELSAKNIDIKSGDYTFRATGQTIVFDGFLKLYPDRAKENILPVVTVGEKLDCRELKPEQHFTEPPARYSDATLVKTLEEFGIGRPSTYAPTIATIEDRGYIERDEKKRLKPKEIAYVVNDLLVLHFPQIVDFNFTAEMENDLDAIAEGTKEWQPIIKNFYVPFKENLKAKDHELNKKELTETATEEVCDKCGKPMVIKMGRFGKFLACTGYPDCKNTKPLPGENGDARPEAIPTDEKCETCGEPMVRKVGRFGPFLSCSDYPKCKTIKSIEKKTNVKCPVCEKGDIIEKRSKRGRTFYACNQYPKCDFALWEKPNGEKCPKCQSLLVFAAKGQIKCSSKECDFSKQAEE